MAMTVCYTTVHGMILHENRGGIETNYVPDTLGNLNQCKNNAGTVTYSAEYWPYGEVRTETGTNPSPWGFVGLLGYLKDTGSRLYVRARYYRPNFALWQTVDPLWPNLSPYGYCFNNPSYLRDPLGLFPAIAIPPVIGLGAGLLAALEAIALALGIALAILLALLLLYGLYKLWRMLCQALYKLQKDVCGSAPRPGDPPGRPSDCSEGRCKWSDSCSSLLYKGAAFSRCAAIRQLYSQVCYGGVDARHWPPILENLGLAAECAAIFRLKCGPEANIGRGIRDLLRGLLG